MSPIKVLTVNEYARQRAINRAIFVEALEAQAEAMDAKRERLEAQARRDRMAARLARADADAMRSDMALGTRVERYARHRVTHRRAMERVLVRDWSDVADRGPVLYRENLARRHYAQLEAAMRATSKHGGSASKRSGNTPLADANTISGVSTHPDNLRPLERHTTAREGDAA